MNEPNSKLSEASERWRFGKRLTRAWNTPGHARVASHRQRDSDWTSPGMLSFWHRAMHKDFDSWNGEKKAIEIADKRPFYHTCKIWWCAVGVNLGDETDGTGSRYDRPVVIIRPFNTQTFFGVAVTGRA